MGNRRHAGGHGFGPSSFKRSTKKKQSSIWKKSVAQTKRTLEHFRVPVANRYNNANGRGDDVFVTQKARQIPPEATSNSKVECHAKDLSCPLSSRLNNGSSRMKNSMRPSSSRPNNSVVGPRNNIEMPSSSRPTNGLKSSKKDRKSSSRPKNIELYSRSNKCPISSEEDVQKSRPSLSRSNSPISRPKPKRSSLRQDNGRSSPPKSKPKLSSLRQDNDRASPPKNIGMPRSPSSIPNIYMVSPSKEFEKSSLSSSPNYGFVPSQKDIEQLMSAPPGASWLGDGISSVYPASRGLDDDSNSPFHISKISHPSSVVSNSNNVKQTMIGEDKNGDLSMGKEASTSSLGLKGKVMQDLQPHFGVNCGPLFVKNLSSRQPAEAYPMSNNTEQNTNHGRLASRKRNTALMNDGRADDDKSKSKITKPLVEEKFDSHEDDDNDVGNGRPKETRRRPVGYEDEDCNYVEQNANHNQLDSRKWNTALTNDGRGDDDKSKGKMMKPLLDEKLDSNEDDDNEVENGRPKKARRPTGDEYADSDYGDQNLASRQSAMASFMTNCVEQKANHNPLDSSKRNTTLTNDGRGDDDRSKGKMAESLLEEKLDSHDDDDNEVENYRLKKRRKLIGYEGEDDDGGGQNLAGVESGTAMITQKVVVKETNVSNPPVSESFKLQHYSSLPIDEPIWSGLIKTCSKDYVSLDAHLSTKYCEIVCKLSRSLQPVVEVTKLSRMEAWPRSFEVSRPTDSDIALYFFPHKMRQRTDLDQLVKEVVENDMVLLAVVGEAEMLIFPSILLPEQHQTFQGRPYLWAAFRPRRANKFRTVEEQRHGKGHCAQEEEMVKQPEAPEEAEGQGMEQEHIPAEGQGMEQEHIPAEGQGMEQVHIPAEGQGMEQEQSSVQPNAPAPVEGVARATSAPTVLAATSASHGQTHSSLGAPTGALFGFVAQLTPRFEQLIQEMQREGAVMVAVRGEMKASSSS
ncbi:hypothetical protein CFC21_092115 [Triticum aestivum]|uniref:AIPP2-like SPOC-like domain-containing protein n=2 Tax=Triticum aestivum TaxID=4565 RepID=A0A9R1LHR5_WHEAT|nr:protein IWS1 homolog A-like [Triticum aestivum]KAF7089071.1 hypothetical protein CFC21_092115 [Triticum aestivum]